VTLIGGSVEQFRNRFMLHASRILVWLHAPICGSVNRTVNSARLPNRRDWRIGQNNCPSEGCDNFPTYNPGLIVRGSKEFVQHRMIHLSILPY